MNMITNRRKIVTIVAGFGRSGKTTLRDQLSLNGIVSASSSDILSVETLDFYDIPVNHDNVKVLENKNESQWRYLKSIYFKDIPFHKNIVISQEYPDGNFVDGGCRRDKIMVAERFIVPAYGRQFFSLKCLEAVENFRDPVIFSTILAEREILISECSDRGYAPCGINLVSADDLRATDRTRTLIKAKERIPYVELFNTKESPEELFTKYVYWHNLVRDSLN